MDQPPVWVSLSLGASQLPLSNSVSHQVHHISQS
jgi:hypothetical protein